MRCRRNGGGWRRDGEEWRAGRGMRTEDRRERRKAYNCLGLGAFLTMTCLEWIHK